jgi:F0F1-type ATP synthase delta subunit
MNKKMEQKTDYLSELLLFKEKIKKYENNLKKLKEKLNKNKKTEELLKSLELINDNKISLIFFFFKN